jgi:hypothetical protein
MYFYFNVFCNGLHCVLVIISKYIVQSKNGCNLA